MKKDLEFLALEVTNWPKDACYVRLDYDGEICFRNYALDDLVDYDFFPENLREAKDSFVKGRGAIGVEYPKETWEAAKDILL